MKLVLGPAAGRRTEEERKESKRGILETNGGGGQGENKKRSCQRMFRTRLLAQTPAFLSFSILSPVSFSYPSLSYGLSPLSPCVIPDRFILEARDWNFSRGPFPPMLRTLYSIPKDSLQFKRILPKNASHVSNIPDVSDRRLECR